MNNTNGELNKCCICCNDGGSCAWHDCHCHSTAQGGGIEIRPWQTAFALLLGQFQKEGDGHKLVLFIEEKLAAARMEAYKNGMEEGRHLAMAEMSQSQKNPSVCPERCESYNYTGQCRHTYLKVSYRRTI